MLQQLIEETGDLYDGFAFLVGELWRSSGQRNHSPTFIVGGLFFCSHGSQTCFGQEWSSPKVSRGSIQKRRHRLRPSGHPRSQILEPDCNRDRQCCGGGARESAAVSTVGSGS